VIKKDISEKQAKIVYLGIGSNLGDRNQNIYKAKYKLQIHGIKIIKSSGNYETPSWPNPKKPKFINIVLKIKTFLSPIKLLEICRKIEKDLGRKQLNKNDPRTCDIDIIDYDGKILNTNNKKILILPHPRAIERNFVLLPLYEISKTWKHPQTKENIVKLINLLKIEDLRTIKQI